MRKGRVDDLTLQVALPTCGGFEPLAIQVAYLCGHPEMIERGKGVLKRIGFERVFEGRDLLDSCEVS